MSRRWPAVRPAPAADLLAAVLDAARATADPDAQLSVSVEPSSKMPVLAGRLGTWSEVVAAGHAAASTWAAGRAIGEIGDVVVEVTADDAPPVAVLEPPGRSADRADPVPERADVVVVGAGICGIVTALALADRGADVAVVDVGSTVGQATTSWNNGMIHSGHDPKPNTDKASLNVAGNARWQALAQRLGLVLERRPSLVAAFEGEEQGLTALVQRAQRNGVPGATIVSGQVARQLEPRLSRKITACLMTPTTAAIDGPAATRAAAARLTDSGGTVSLGTAVTRIVVQQGAVLGVETTAGPIIASVVVNAAGVHADLLAATAGSRRYSLHPRRGSLIIFDPPGEPYLTSVGPVPGPYSKGGGMTVRPDGRTTGGPTAVEQSQRSALPPTQQELDQIYELGARIYPEFPLDAVASVGSQVRAATYGEDFVVGAVPGILGLIDIAGTQSPALASAPAIAARVAEILTAYGFIDK